MCCSTSSTPRSPRLVKLGDRRLDLGDHRRLDAFGRLVEDQALRRRDQRAGDRQLLALPTRQQARPPRQQFLQRGEQVELLVDQLLAVLAAVGDDLKVLRRRQLPERLLALRHVRQAARHPRARPQFGDVVAVEKHLARTAFQQSDRGAQQRRLARPVVAHHRGHPVGRHLEGDAVDDLGAAVAGADVDKLEHQELSSMSSSGMPSAPGGGGTQVDLLHLGVGLHLGHRALGDHLPARQHGHRCGERPHEVHVVFDDDDRALTADAAQQVSGLLALLVTHAGDRLVEQQHVGVLHQQHADLQPLLLPVGQHPSGLVDQIGQTRCLQSLLDRRQHRRAPPQQRPRRPARARRDVEVLQHRQLLEHARGLERASHSEAGDLVHLLAEQLDTGLADRSGGGHQPGDRVDHGGLAGAVGPDQEPQVALEQGEVDVADRLEPVEIDRQAADFEVLGAHAHVAAGDGFQF